MTRIACLFVPGAAERVQPALLEIALRHSPSVEDGGPGIVYLDLGGLDRLERITPTLEDVFVSLTGRQLRDE